MCSVNDFLGLKLSGKLVRFQAASIVLCRVAPGAVATLGSRRLLAPAHLLARAKNAPLALVVALPGRVDVWQRLSLELFVV